jgi:hypothetical protein
MFPPARERAHEGEAPWWESADHLPELNSPEPTAATIDLTDRSDNAVASAASVTEDNASGVTKAEADPATIDVDPATTSHSSTNGVATKTATTGGITARGAFLLIAICCAIGCGVGFLTGSTTSIPSQAGWGLVIGTVIAALLSPPKLGWTVAWLPPLAAATVVALLGQVTLLGSTPTLAREIAMIAAGLTTLAPAQVLSVTIAIVLLLVRRKLTKQH